MPLSRGADATTPIDYTQRNGPFAPGATVPVRKKTLPMAETLQNRRVEPPTIDKIPAAVGDRRSAIDVRETQPKNVLPKETRRPETVERTVSAFNHRAAAFTTATDAPKPPMVAKYQDSLTAANATKTARFPAFGRATAAKINRFVFRKNAPESSVATGGVAITPAAGGSPVVK